MGKLHLSVVVPVHNEEASLLQLQKNIEEVLDNNVWDWEVIYVDDGSTDASHERMLEIHNQRPDKVRLIQMRRNFGQTQAMAAGFDAARGEVVIPIDADLQNDPADIPTLMKKIEEGYDVVSGWRADRQDSFLSRTLPSRIANALISRLTKVHLHDYGCTLKAYRAEILSEMRIYGEMHRFLPALASWVGARITEVKVNHHPRIYGETKYGIGRTRRVILDLITVKFLLAHTTNPMHIFGKWGFRSIFMGMLFAAILIVQKILPPYQDITDSAYLYLSMIFSLGGLQMIFTGLLGEVSVRTYYESQDRRPYSVRQTHGFEKDE